MSNPKDSDSRKDGTLMGLPKGEEENKMNHDEFLKSVLRTARSNFSPEKQLNNVLLGLAGETGELIDCYKKQLFQDHPEDITKVINEVGDILYYLYLLSHTQGFTIDECMIANQAKLQRRYPVEFSPEQSLNRS